MKKGKRILALGTAAMLTLTLAACGTQAAPKELTPEDILARAIELSSEKISSLESEILVDMGMEVSVGGQSETMEGTVAMHMVSFLDPMKLKMEMLVDLEGEPSQSQAIYIQQGESKNLYEMYTQISGDWFHTVVSAEDVGDYMESAGTEAYLESSDVWNYKGDEEMEGVTAARYEGEISGADLTDLLNDTGTMESIAGLDQLGISKDNIIGMIQEMEPTTIQLWIDKESCYPIRFEMDMASMVNTLMDGVLKAMEESGLSLDGISIRYSKLSMRVDYMNYNQAEDFQIPEEALAA